MFLSKMFPKTLREDPTLQSSPGTRWLLRGGFIEQVASGIWIMTPWGLRVRRQIEALIREAMDSLGGLEVELPILQPVELWEFSGRAQTYRQAGIAFGLSDRKGQAFFLAPTAEEVITRFAGKHLRSYRDLPVLFWQMAPKFRDELRPRQGLIRGREFLMKDAYSFAADREGMQQTFEQMREAYAEILTRLSFDWLAVEADSGTIGGSGSVEFMALTPTGEDTLLRCNHCGYGGNQEKAQAFFQAANSGAENELMSEVHTPHARSVADVAQQLGKTTADIAKTLFLRADHQLIGVVLRGDLDLNLVKLERLTGAQELTLADAETVFALTGCLPGFVGPVGLTDKSDDKQVHWYFDHSLQTLGSWICGANREHWHLQQVRPGRDLEVAEYVDLASATAGLSCGQCRTGVLEIRQGIELGHVFQLQQSYSEALEARFTTDRGQSEAFWMGCYGLGVSRMVQALAEQHHDDRGLIWPLAVAPAQVLLVPVNLKAHGEAAKSLYQQLRAAGVRVALDDRDLRLGEKLTDAELLGFPVQVLIGRSWEQEQTLEVRWRDTRSWDTERFSQSRPDGLPQAMMSAEALLAWIGHRTTGPEV